MSKGRNVDWALNQTLDGKFEEGQAKLGVLMDIRDELRKVNQLLSCRNFMNIPYKLDRISANTHRVKRKKRSTTTKHPKGE